MAKDMDESEFVEHRKKWITRLNADEGDGPDLGSLEWANEFSKFIGYR